MRRALLAISLLLAVGVNGLAQSNATLTFGSSVTFVGASIVGDGSTDNTAAIQAAVNSCTSDCTINLVNVVVAGQITVPTTYTFTFTATGDVNCTSTSNCFYRTSNGPQVLARMRFLNINFTKSTSGTIIWDNLQFYSGGNGGTDIVGCKFTNLANNIVDVGLSGSNGSTVNNTVFNSTSSLTNVWAIESIVNNVDGNQYISTPMQAIIDGNSFFYVGAFQVVQLNSDVAGDPGEGWQWHANHFTDSSITVTGNEWNFNGNEFVSAELTLLDISNSSIVGNYFDCGGGDTGESLLTIEGTTHTTISGNVFVLLIPNSIGVDFEYGPSGGTTNITLTGNLYVGPGNASTGDGYGIEFNDGTARNVYVGGENFRTVTAALHFDATLDKSTIDRFEARDVYYYAQNLAANHGTYLRSDPLYQSYDIHLSGYVAAVPSSNQEIASTTLTFLQMFENPQSPTFTVITGDSNRPCTTGMTINQANGGWSTTPDSLGIALFATPSASVGYAACDATVVLDDTIYVAPR